MRLRIVVVLGLLLTALTHAQTTKPAERVVAYEMCLFLPDDAPRADAAEAWFRKQWPKAVVGDLKASFETSAVTVRQFPIDEFAVDADYLKKYERALDDAERARFVGAKGVLSVVFRTRRDHAVATYRQVGDAMLALAKEFDAPLFDAETRQYYSAETWQKRFDTWDGDVPNVGRHITIHLYESEPEQKLLRAVTLGMMKFGQPDLVLDQLVPHNTHTYGALLNIAAQTLVESPDRLKQRQLALDISAIRHAKVRASNQEGLMDGAKPAATFTVEPAKREDGDPHNTLLRFTFAESAGATIQEKQNAALSSFFGARDSVANIKHDDAILAASEAAKKRLPDIRERFNKGLEPGTRVLVKAPFKTTQNTNEWMWVVVMKWQDENIQGILANDPNDVPQLKAGARVDVKQSDVFDYLIYKRDGSMEGNETGELMEKQARE